MGGVGGTVRPVRHVETPILDGGLPVFGAPSMGKVLIALAVAAAVAALVACWCSRRCSLRRRSLAIAPVAGERNAPTRSPFGGAGTSSPPVAVGP